MTMRCMRTGWCLPPASAPACLPLSWSAELARDWHCLRPQPAGRLSTATANGRIGCMSVVHWRSWNWVRWPATSAEYADLRASLWSNPAAEAGPQQPVEYPFLSIHRKNPDGDWLSTTCASFFSIHLAGKSDSHLTLNMCWGYNLNCQ